MPEIHAASPAYHADDVRRLVRGIRHALWLLPIHAALLIWGTWQHQPDPKADFVAWSRFVSTGHFLISHVVASIGGQTISILGIGSMVAVGVAVGASARLLLMGGALHTIGSGFLIAGFGVAALAQPAVGDLAAKDLGLAKETYTGLYTPQSIVLLLAGALLFGLATLWTAAALKTVEAVPAWARRAYGLSGPLFTIVGVLVGVAQTAGAVLMLVASLAIVSTLLHQVKGWAQ